MIFFFFLFFFVFFFLIILLSFFFFNDTAPTEIYTLSLHDALPIWSTAMVGLLAGRVRVLAGRTQTYRLPPSEGRRRPLEGHTNTLLPWGQAIGRLRGSPTRSSVDGPSSRRPARRRPARGDHPRYASPPSPRPAPPPTTAMETIETRLNRCSPRTRKRQRFTDAPARGLRPRRG